MALALMGPGGGGSKITAKMITNMESYWGIIPYLMYDGILQCCYSGTSMVTYILIDFTYLKTVSFNVGYFVNNGGYGNRTGVVWVGDTYTSYDTTLYKQNVTIKNSPDTNSRRQ